MPKLYKSLAIAIRAFALATVILAGLAVALIRGGLPWVEDYRSELEAAAAEHLGVPLRVARVGARLRGLDPELVMRDVSVISPNGDGIVFSIEQLSTSVDLLASLRAGTLVLGQIRAFGASIRLHRSNDGRLFVAGIKASGSGVPLSALYGKLQLVGGAVLVEDPLGAREPLDLVDVNIRLQREGEQLRVGGRASLRSNPTATLHVAIDANGVGQSLERIAARAYVQTSAWPTETVDWALPNGFAATEGTMDTALWIDRTAQGDWTTVGSFAFTISGARGPEGDVGPANGLQALGAEGLIYWHSGETGWDLVADDLRFVRQSSADEERSRKHRIGVAWRAKLNEDFDLGIAVDRLKIEDMAGIAERVIELPGVLQDRLKVLAPGGEASDLRFALSSRGGHREWVTSGRVSGLSFGAEGAIPGAQGIDVVFSANERGAVADLHSAGAKVDFPRLFRQPLYVDRIAGQVRWSRSWDGGWLLTSDDIRVENAHIKTRTRFRFEQPGSRGSPFLDLQTDFGTGVGRFAHLYYPTGIMPQPLVDWLDRAIVDARVSAGACVFRGYLKDFPFKEEEGRFEVLFEVEDAELDYLPDWPKIEKAAAQVRFLNNSLKIRVRDGKLLESRIPEAEVVAAQLTPHATLEVIGKVDGTAENGLTILGETTLAKDFAELARNLRSRGPLGLQLSLRLPLGASAGRPEVSGTIQFRGNSLTVLPAEMDLTKLRGTLKFSNSGIEGTDIRASFLDRPIVLEVATVRSGERTTPSITRIRAEGRIPVGTLLQNVPMLAGEITEGASDWLAILDLDYRGRGGFGGGRFLLESELEGTLVNLPPPMGKPASERRKFAIEAELDPREPLVLHLTYGAVGTAVFALDRSGDDKLRIGRGVLRFGPGEARLPGDPGFWIWGALPEVDLRDWARILRTRREPNDLGDVSDLMKEVSLRIGRVSHGSAEVQDARLTLRRTSTGWRGQLDADRVSGNVYAPFDVAREALRIDLARLQLDLPGRGDEEPAPSSEEFDIDPRQLPSLEMKVKNLEVNGKSLGTVSLSGKKGPTGLTLDSIRVESDELRADGWGFWLREKERTQVGVGFDLQSSNLGRLLADLGLNPSLEKGEAEIRADLKWKGTPFSPRLTDLQGSLSGTVRKGRIVQVDPGVGRLFGLVNLGALQRRLTLDFSDMFDEGFAFDIFRASFKLASGSATTDDAFIDGPAASIAIRGRTGLIERVYDQEVTVTPHVSTGLPVAAALAGGPTVGAAALVAQQILGKQIDKISRTTYRIQGPWEEPSISQVSVEAADDAGGRSWNPFLQ